MTAPREIEDVVRTLVHHQHDHPPVRDLNGELDRRATRSDRVSLDFIRLVGSWSFLLLQVVLVVAWLLLNTLARFNHWDGHPFAILNLILGLEAVLGISLVLMAHHRIADRERIESQQDFEIRAKEEEETRAIMSHLESQDQIMLQLLYRLEHTERELQRLNRTLSRTGVP